MRNFFGKTYEYATPNLGVQKIGVLQGLGDTWIVGYRKEGTASAKRIKTPALPVMTDPAELQAKLDAWAEKRQLREVI